MSNEKARDGYVFVCGACGKTSPSKWGHRDASLGWDESCAMNSVECRIDHIEYRDDGRVKHVRDGGFDEVAAEAVAS